MISLSVGFFTTLILLILSRLGYKNYVLRESAKFDINNINDRDIIDKIDDPHDLYSDENSSETEQDLKKVVAEEKQKHNLKHSLKISIKTLPANLSILRIFGYIILISGFFYLKDSGNLEIGNYLIGITAGIILIVIITMAKIWNDER